MIYKDDLPAGKALMHTSVFNIVPKLCAFFSN